MGQMLDDALAGRFEESDYDESELSRLEVKWKRYLSSSKLSADKLAKERKNIQELVTDISHQTRTAVANILLYGQLLQEQDLDEESKKLLEQMLHYSGRLEFLIQLFVKTSRLEAGTFSLKPKKQELGQLADELAQSQRAKADEKGITLAFFREDHDSTAVFDRKWTLEAAGNILDNAIKYSPGNSVIEIRVFTYEMFAGIEIADHGAGIAEEEIPLIFSRFYRGKNVQEEDGIGVGLFLARQIIEGQGGYIRVVSKPGKGSRFQLFLPR